jgi:hypothetical protein
MAKAMASRWQSFPNIGGLTRTLGEYDQFSQTIRLFNVTAADLRKAFTSDDLTLRRDVLPLLAHEVRHFGDHVGTIWGRETLIHLFNAYNARLQPKISEYWRVTQVLRDHRDSHLASYYSEETDLVAEDWDGTPWRYDLTTGVHLNPDGTENENRPIMFTRFSTYSGGYLCRVPFSIASLLEIRAMANELFQLMGIIIEIKDGAVQKIEENDAREKANKRLFDASLAVYSVAAHYLSNTIREIKDVFEAYLIGAEIAGVCLNMPRKFFAGLRVPDSFSVWGARNESFKRNCDRGYLYAVLIKNHPRGLRGVEDINTWIEKALEESGLPPLETISKAVLEEDVKLVVSVLDGPVSHRLADLLEVGKPYLTHLCEPRRAGGILLNPATPPVLTSDSKFVSLPGWPNASTFSVPEKWHEMAYRCYTRMEQFLDACVI